MKAHSTLTSIIHKRYLPAMALGLLVAISACSSEKAGLDKLRELCEKDAGLTINKTVEADGYYDATRKGGALWVLIPSEYNFTEFCDFDTNKPSFSVPGCWRLRKISRETNQCNTQIDKALSRNGSDASRAFREKSCIAVEKLEKPTARYGYYSDLKSWPAANGFSVYMKNTESIMDTLSGEIVGAYITYLYDKKPPHSVPTACSDFIEGFPSYTEAKFVESTIKFNRELKE